MNTNNTPKRHYRRVFVRCSKCFAKYEVNWPGILKVLSDGAKDFHPIHVESERPICCRRNRWLWVEWLGDVKEGEEIHPNEIQELMELAEHFEDKARMLEVELEAVEWERDSLKQQLAEANTELDMMTDLMRKQNAACAAMRKALELAWELLESDCRDLLDDCALNEGETICQEWRGDIRGRCSRSVLRYSEV